MVRQRSIGLGRSAALVVAGAEPLSPATRMEPGAEGWLAWCGLPSRPLEARALLKRGAIACPPLLRFNGACPSLPAAALPMPPRNAGTSITVTCRGNDRDPHRHAISLRTVFFGRFHRFGKIRNFSR